MKGNFEMPKRNYDSGSESSNESGSKSDNAKKPKIGERPKRRNFLQQHSRDQAKERTLKEGSMDIDKQISGKRKAEDSSDEKNKGHKKGKLDGDVEKMRALDTMFKQVMKDMEDLQIANKDQEKLQAINDYYRERAGYDEI